MGHPVEDAGVMRAVGGKRECQLRLCARDLVDTAGLKVGAAHEVVDGGDARAAVANCVIAGRKEEIHGTFLRASAMAPSKSMDDNRTPPPFNHL